MFILAVSTKNMCDNIAGVIGVAGFALKAIMIIGPILLILWGSIDLLKSIIQGKEDDIKKSQKVLIRRVISAVLLLLLPFLVMQILGLIGAEDWRECWTKHKNDGIIYDVDNNER